MLIPSANMTCLSLKLVACARRKSFPYSKKIQTLQSFVTPTFNELLVSLIHLIFLNFFGFLWLHIRPLTQSLLSLNKDEHELERYLRRKLILLSLVSFKFYESCRYIHRQYCYTVQLSFVSLVIIYTKK